MAELDSDRAAEVAIATTYDQTGVAIITVSGELDASNSDALQATVASVAAAQPDALVFSLSGLSYMDSAGISVLLSAAEKVAAVRLRDPSPAVRRVIDVTGLLDVLSIES